MLESEMIADELDRMNHGGAWHGPAIRETLNGVSAGEAVARPIPGAHNIWEIVLHMTAWADEVGRRLEQDARPLTGEADWPAVGPTTETEWEDTRTGLSDAHRRLRLAIREFPPGRLQDQVGGLDNGGPPDSFYVMLHGLAQHDAYHTGQISLLKKAMAGQGV
jgi:hypothetical protein